MAMPEVKQSMSQMQNTAQSMMQNSPYLQFTSSNMNGGQTNNMFANSDRDSANKTSMNDSQTMREY
jgi:hypothetical protein